MSVVLPEFEMAQGSYGFPDRISCRVIVDVPFYRAKIRAINVFDTDEQITGYGLLDRAYVIGKEYRDVWYQQHHEEPPEYGWELFAGLAYARHFYDRPDLWSPEYYEGGMFLFPGTIVQDDHDARQYVAELYPDLGNPRFGQWHCNGNHWIIISTSAIGSSA